MKDYSEIAKKITKTFESQLFSLSLRHQAHFATRKWRISGDQRYCPPIFYDFQLRTLRMVEAINSLEQKQSQGKMETKMLKKWEPSSTRGIQKKKMYQRNPGFFLYTRLIHYLFLLKTYGLEKEVLRDLYLRGSGYLKKIDFSKLLFSPDFIRFDPSIAVNTIYYLQYLGKTDLESKFKPIFYKFWREEEAKEKDVFKSKIYGLTHLIIAASYFYQRFIPADDFNWVLSFFEKNFNQITKLTSPDVIGEVGLCFKLTKTPSWAMEEAQKCLASCFSSRFGYIPREKEGRIEKAEHRNIIAILLLSSYSKLYPGPNLAEFIKVNKKSFYLPLKGDFLES